MKPDRGKRREESGELKACRFERKGNRIKRKINLKSKKYTNTK